MSPPSRVKKTKNYDAENMKKALACVESGTPINAASRRFQVPRTSLLRKFKNPFLKAKPGPSTVLTSQEEEDLVKWILKMYELGCPISKDNLINSVSWIIKNNKRINPFVDGRPGRHWYEGFLKRHPILSPKISENVSLAKAPVTENSLQQWFQYVEKYLEENHLLEISGCRIFNTGETVLSLNPKGDNVLAKKESKNIYNVVNYNENLTTLVTASAAGQLAPTLVLLKYQRVPTAIYENLPSNFCIGSSDTGMMTSQLFYEYITNSFHPWLLKSKIELPVILYLDGHVCHLTFTLSKFCNENGIILIALPPNSAHFMQPMDVSVFSPLKAHWKKEVNNYRIEKVSLSVPKHEFAVLLASVFTKINMPTLLSNGFHLCGLHPFSMKNVDLSKIFIKSRENQN